MFFFIVKRDLDRRIHLKIYNNNNNKFFINLNIYMFYLNSKISFKKRILN